MFINIKTGEGKVKNMKSKDRGKNTTDDRGFITVYLHCL